MTKIIFAISIVLISPFFANGQNFISGKITSEGKPVAQAKISVEGTLLQSFSDADGNFKIAGIKTDSIILLISD